MCVLFADKAIPSAEKRIVLHSTTDILTVITNLTGQLASITAEFAAVKQDNIQLKSLVQAMQTNNSQLVAMVDTIQNNNSNLQTKVHALQGFRAKQESLIRMLQNNITDIQAVAQTLQNNVVTLQTRASSGSTYVRWGKSSCTGSGTQTVYSGYAAGGHRDHSGAGTNHLCLTPDPIYGKYRTAQDAGGELYGVEYMMWDSASLPFYGTSLRNHDVPCSVCRPPRSSVVMIPGRNTCYNGWYFEYSGYLASGGYDYASASEYICLDSHPDTITGGQGASGGGVLYLVEGICGSLKCPPYVNARELTCVVCSK